MATEVTMPGVIIRSHSLVRYMVLMKRVQKRSRRFCRRLRVPSLNLLRVTLRIPGSGSCEGVELGRAFPAIHGEDLMISPTPSPAIHGRALAG